MASRNTYVYIPYNNSPIATTGSTKKDFNPAHWTVFAEVIWNGMEQLSEHLFIYLFRVVG